MVSQSDADTSSHTTGRMSLCLSWQARTETDPPGSVARHEEGRLRQRQRVHRYYLISFIIGCATVLTIFGVAVWRSWGTADISVDLYKSSTRADPTRTPPKTQRSSATWQSIVDEAHADESQFIIPTPKTGKPSGLGAYFDALLWAKRDAMERENTLEYHYEKNGNKITIEPHIELVEKQRRGEVIQGFAWSYQPFKWDFPVLSVKIVNNSNRNILLTEATFQIDKSEIDVRPIIVVRGQTHSGVAEFINEGWGEISNVVARFNVAEYERCGGNFDPSEPYLEPVDYARDYGTFLITSHVQDTLIDKVKRCDDVIDTICADGMCESAKELNDIRCLDTRPRDVCSRVSRMPDEKFIKKFLAESTKFSEGKHPPVKFERSCSETPVCVQGRITYNDAAEKQESVKFSTIVILEEPEAGASRPPSYEYGVILQAGKSGYTLIKAISQEVKP
jgi:hypothetical protein